MTRGTHCATPATASRTGARDPLTRGVSGAHSLARGHRWGTTVAVTPRYDSHFTQRTGVSARRRPVTSHPKDTTRYRRNVTPDGAIAPRSRAAPRIPPGLRAPARAPRVRHPVRHRVRHRANLVDDPRRSATEGFRRRPGTGDGNAGGPVPLSAGGGGTGARSARCSRPNAGRPRAPPRWPRQATAVPSSSTSWAGSASRDTPSRVVAGATPAAPRRDARTS